MNVFIAAVVGASLAASPAVSVPVESALTSPVYNVKGDSRLGDITLDRVGSPISDTYGDGEKQNAGGEWFGLPPITDFSEVPHTFSYELGGSTDLIAGVTVRVPEYAVRPDLVIYQEQSGVIPSLLSTNSETHTQEVSFTIPGVTHYLTDFRSEEVTGLGIVFDIEVTDTVGRTAVFRYGYSAGNAGLAFPGVSDPVLDSHAPLFTACDVKGLSDLQVCGQWTGIRFQQFVTPPSILPTPVTPPVDPPTEQPPTEQPPTEQPPTEQPPTEQPPSEEPPIQDTPVLNPNHPRTGDDSSSMRFWLGLSACAVVLAGGLSILLVRRT